MKWMCCLPIFLILTACGFNRAEIIEPQEVIAVKPLLENKAFINYGTSLDVTHTRVYCN
ncbi:hypothetical protein [Legionella londiniensis]|uniref:Uncharacterized protein n=1 Tax=Legionella londiniensis TaxID=45068 RepID=A0A0W0VJS1_9GAMM|nr:hypothetical protein [Legionella londiniensis]KTD20340.1 hypothetical protein Llon_1693 [Legionella londiniensis]STX93943.1 Uncharacterised protein [Legionella londiniensis]